MDNIGNGIVTLPIEVYQELYNAQQELNKMKNSIVRVTKDYQGNPRIQISVTNEAMSNAFDKVADEWPDYEFSYNGDAREEVYSAIVKKDKSDIPTLD